MATLNDTRPVTVALPMLEDLDSGEKNALRALIVRLIGESKAEDLTPEEAAVAALVYTGE